MGGEPLSVQGVGVDGGDCYCCGARSIPPKLTVDNYNGGVMCCVDDWIVGAYYKLYSTVDREEEANCLLILYTC